MYRKKATLLTTFNSLATLPKVRRYPNSQSCIKTLALLCNFSTATERSDFRSDFDTSTEINSDYYADYKQNNNGFYRNNSGKVGNWNVGGKYGQFEENPHGFYVRNGNQTGVVYQQNPSRVYPINPRQQNPVGKSGVFASNSDSNMSFDGFKKGFQPNQEERNGDFMPINEFQHGSGGQNVNFGRESYESMQQNSGAIYQRREGGNGNFTNGHFREGHRTQLQQSSVGRSGNLSNGGSVGAERNLNWNHRTNPALQTGGFSDGYGGASQHNGMSHNVGKVGTLQQNSQNIHAGRPGNIEQMQGGYGNARMRQQIISEDLKAGDESSGNYGDMNMTGRIEELDHYVEEGKLEEAVKVLGLLGEQGIKVDLPRYLALMTACGKDKALEEAKCIHQHLMRSIPNLEVSTYNKILEMYCQCRAMEDAYSIFEKMPQHNLTSWDIMIAGLAKNGHGENAIELFTEFKELGLKPDGQMYLGVFSACADLLDTTEGMLHFEAMSKDYGIVPSMEHYVSVVDMLGSAGYLDEALEFIEKMPVQPSVEVWETLMHLSRVQGNMELGDHCAELVELLDPSRLNEQSRAGLIPFKASDLSKGKEKRKADGHNPLEVRSRVHEFRAGDRSDPDHEKLYALLRGLKHQMKEAGYIPETKVVLHDIDQESKEEAVLGHSERLAVAKGLLNTPARSAMRIIKNLRICLDCHNAMKIISKLVGRELIMRDAKRFHHFKDGVCSCRDYW
ncbi:pentatricopeptide repeat-containing protein At4g32450, mitochondrial [Coffea arabica]|uniref:Pentatricopeptide repeat-containing protein At4g32450, mitochondrial-like n=1 Tax=Coffea arabica TaxID=13443 RepID=A0A6P6U3X9_COFAR|nr:pentatricopeptide repeat-containing protein At4g32450, mitochondrial-like [Coffea arabica]XP_027085302.1 pentatricopeptide repeat-containing protein At4g32450, mitochondrial-like [Coffea arabica]XP_027085303.1 pentatricopeptide repeat-containing protein At4g32450, mitochondrial-like [Coffea arabica]XP_027085304.1 pentatricopeptide repeat-containing protein At4g32450, mitochondrial-like [Coffea arabica]XP_027085305.1 pentatricopeptide repeat-containing protein At4g32450, mitochondrial-like [C